MVADNPGSRGVEAARRAAQMRVQHDEAATQSPTEHDVEQTDRKVEAARLSAAQAARSAAESFDRSASMHAELAEVEEGTVQRIAAGTERQEESARFHRRAAEEDRRYADQKRDEAAADEITDGG